MEKTMEDLHGEQKKRAMEVIALIGKLLRKRIVKPLALARESVNQVLQ